MLRSIVGSVLPALAPGVPDRFDGRVCVITGAASGIGAALARTLAGHGARLALVDVDEVGLAGTAVACRDAGAAAVRVHLVDVADREAVVALADEVPDALGPAFLVVNNAGVALLADVEEMRWEDLDWLLGINLGGVLAGTKAFLPQLRETGGHLVNISSVFGFLGIPDQSAYSTAKFAVAGFTGAVREESRAKGWGVTVTCVHPGGVATPIAARARTADGVDPQPLVRLFDRVARTSPDAAARAILAGAAAGHGRVLVGPDAHLLAVLTGVLPADTVHRILVALGGQWSRSASEQAGSGVPSAPPADTLEG